MLFCEGEVTQAQLGGEDLRLQRRIEAPIGGAPSRDRGHGREPRRDAATQASLYHFNIGFPLLMDGTVVEHAGRRLLGPLSVPDAAASREAASWPVDAGQAECTVRTIRPAGDRPSITFAWSAGTLPHLQLWHDLRPGRCVLGVEPCTSPRLTGGRSGQEPILEPGGVRQYEIRISVDERR